MTGERLRTEPVRDFKAQALTELEERIAKLERELDSLREARRRLLFPEHNTSSKNAD